MSFALYISLHSQQKCFHNFSIVLQIIIMNYLNMSVCLVFQVELDEHLLVDFIIFHI